MLPVTLGTGVILLLFNWTIGGGVCSPTLDIQTQSSSNIHAYYHRPSGGSTFSESTSDNVQHYSPSSGRRYYQPRQQKQQQQQPSYPLPHQNVYHASPSPSSVSNVVHPFRFSSSSSANVPSSIRPMSIDSTDGFSQNLYSYGSAAVAPSSTTSSSSLLSTSDSDIFPVRSKEFSYGTESSLTTMPISHSYRTFGHSGSSMPSTTSTANGISGSDGNSVPVGIVLGHPLTTYDGHYYVPVFYPASWVMPMAESSITSTFAQAAPPPKTTGSHLSPVSLYTSSSYGYQSNQPYIPTGYSNVGRTVAVNLYEQAHPTTVWNSAYRSVPKSAKRSSSIPIFDMLRPSFVSSPSSSSSLMFSDDDFNDNHKRSSPSSSSSDYNGYDFAWFRPYPSGESYQHLYDSPTDQSRGHSAQYHYPSVEDSVVGGAYETNTGEQPLYVHSPVIKIRDYNDDLQFAIQARKEQMKAQKQFEKEVLLDDYDRPILVGSSSSGNNITHSTVTSDSSKVNSSSSSSSVSVSGKPGNWSDSTRAQSSNMNGGASMVSTVPFSSSSSSTSPALSATPVSSKMPSNIPIMTRIEIFDLPGANRYLGLSQASNVFNLLGHKRSLAQSIEQ